VENHKGWEILLLLTLLVGRARTGKTNLIADEIRQSMEKGECGMLLIVPEQYSHYAERHLCSVCGDRLSLHAEVLSFTGLCSRVFDEVGVAGEKLLDNSGQILVMHKALEPVKLSLKVLATKRMRTEVSENLLNVVKELKSFKVTPEMLENASSRTSSPLSEKLHDLALIHGAYDALLDNYGGDSTGRLSLLADMICDSSIGNGGQIYFDGFNDFTAQEIDIIKELLRKKAKVTVSLTCSPFSDNSEFIIPNSTLQQLKRLADGLGVKHKINHIEASPDLVTTNPKLMILEKHIFDSFQEKRMESDGVVSIFEAPTRYAECEQAVAIVMNLVSDGCRWRDIAVMAREWDEYSSLCENIFDKYDIPYFSSGKADVLGKAPIALIDAALEIVTTRWEYKSVLRYIKLGLVTIDARDCAVFENYVTMWKIRGSLWTKEWKMPPSGYGRSGKNDDDLLRRLNDIRENITSPLIKLQNDIKGDSKTADKLRYLYEFLVDIGLSGNLLKRAEEFDERGEKRMADEYTQLWDIIINTINQMYDILGDKSHNPTEFRKLLTLAFSQNDVGVIPISLDRVALGGMQMSRRRDIKHLILLGATDDKMPMISKGSGVLSDNERLHLKKLGTNISAGFEDHYNREMNMLYLTLTQPSDRLFILYSSEGGSRPSFIVRNLLAMFGMTANQVVETDHFGGSQDPKRLSGVGDEWRSLNEQLAKELYGERLSLSATRTDTYYSCPYKQFLQYGLKLEPQIVAEFDAMTAGNFMHYVLDGVLSEVISGGGVKKASDEAVERLTSTYIDKFVREKLLEFEGRNTRFKRLFERYISDTQHVVDNVIDELRNSDFEPLAVELDMRDLSNTQTGHIDRVDGYMHENKHYLRVIDYKTRKKAYAFEISDVLHGRDMQMLIYLFALTKYGQSKFGNDINAAGVLYVPARDVVLNASRNDTDERIGNKRNEEMRRSGLILHEDSILEAMENGEEKKYLPVTRNKSGDLVGDSLIEAKQIEILSSHVSNMISKAEKEILGGSTKCKPYYKSENDNACNYCVYKAVCHFDEEKGDKKSYVRKTRNDEAWSKMLGDSVSLNQVQGRQARNDKED